MMKYFTLEGWIGDQDLDSDITPAFRAVDDYKAYLNTIMARLPRDLQRLSEEFNLHDGHLRELVVNAPAGTVSIRFDAADLNLEQARIISLHYSGVTELRSTGDPDKGLPGPHGYGDLGNHELEVRSDGLFEHRFVFSSGIQMLIRFADATLEVHPAK